jgi:hypothetical protein
VSKKIILIFLILNTLIFAQKFYYIKLGSFKQWNVLRKSIDRLPPNMRSHVVVVEANGWLIPYAYYTSKLYALKRVFYRYKRYFPDAIITSSRQILNKRIFRDYRKNRHINNNTIKRRYQPPPVKPRREEYEIDYNQNYFAQIPEIPKEERVSSVVSQFPILNRRVEEREPNRATFNKRLLSGHSFYLTYKSPDRKNDLLIKLSFGAFDVKYQPIIGSMDMKEAKYLIDGDRLYMFADTFSESGAYSKIERVTKDYMVVSSWYGGKKINTLRYYFSLDKAKKYLGRDTSNRLENALEDRSFDKIEQAFIGVDGVFVRSDDEDW